MYYMYGFLSIIQVYDLRKTATDIIQQKFPVAQDKI